jgi:nitroimidazol reductase NimA-like FMN-containing flavoprotein (pyridoxamine 5'-phosphate oxidase superfamily)
VTLRGLPLSGEEAAFVEAARVAHIATTAPDGSPHVVPISPVLDLDRLLFATEIRTAKVRNIRANASVTVCVDRYSEDWTALQQVILYGAAYFIETGMEFERDRNLLYGKFPQYPTEAPIEEGSSIIVEIEVERASTWGFGT